MQPTKLGDLPKFKELALKARIQHHITQSNYWHSLFNKLTKQGENVSPGQLIRMTVRSLDEKLGIDLIISPDIKQPGEKAQVLDFFQRMAEIHIAERNLLQVELLKLTASS